MREPRKGQPREIHGAYSHTRIRAKARSHKRRFLERIGVRATQLDAITREKLNHWARGQAQLDLFDATGEAGTRNYWTAFNGVTRALRDLETRVHAVGLDDHKPAGRSALESYLANGSGGK